MLTEIGFLASGLPPMLSFHDFDLTLGGKIKGPGATRRLPHMHQCYQLTQRGYELCVAIFDGDDLSAGPLQGKLPSNDEVVATYIRFVESAIETGPFAVQLEFKAENQEPLTITMAEKPLSEGCIDFSLISEFCSQGSIILTDVGAAVLKHFAGKRLVQGMRQA
jgi:hypothetical protein